MRLFAEEARSGSLETLMTLPVSGLDVTVGKFLAAFISGASVLVPTLAYAVTAAFLGEPEWGPIVGGYLGALFLIASFTAIGLFCLLAHEESDRRLLRGPSRFRSSSR